VELEQADVDQLQTFSARRILAMLKGARGSQLEREQAEVEAALGRVAEIGARRADARSAQLDAHDRLASYRNAEEDLALVLSAKETLLRRRGGSAGQRLAAIARERGAFIAQVKELNEAISAGRAALTTINLLLEKLSSAGAWSTYDTFLGGGLIASMVKHTRMDAAASLSRSADGQLRAFRRELGDVRAALLTDTLELSPGTRFVDTWFDNIFTDLSVRSRISAANESAHEVRNAVSDAIQMCVERLHDAVARQAQLDDERSRLLAAAENAAP
jgi:hypothetical protein